MRKKISKFAASFATGTAFLGSCCALPLLLMGLGAGSAGFAAVLAPFRPYLILVTVLFFGIAFYTVYGAKTVCAEGDVCNAKTMRRTKIWLWIAFGLALIFLIGPDILARFIF